MIKLMVLVFVSERKSCQKQPVRVFKITKQVLDTKSIRTLTRHFELCARKHVSKFLVYKKLLASQTQQSEVKYFCILNHKMLARQALLIFSQIRISRVNKRIFGIQSPQDRQKVLIRWRIKIWNVTRDLCVFSRLGFGNVQHVEVNKKDNHCSFNSLTHNYTFFSFLQYFGFYFDYCIIFFVVFKIKIFEQIQTLDYKQEMNLP